MLSNAQMCEWVRAAREGDEHAFQELVRTHQDIAVAYATTLLGDVHLAHDAAQEAFVEAYRSLPALREPAAFPAWFRTLIVKYCDRLTRRKRHPVVAVEAAMNLASSEPSPLEAIEAREEAAALRQAIAQLSDAQQQVVVLYYMGERSHKEIAEFLGVPTNVVKTRLYAARRRLRRHLERIESGLRAARVSNSTEFTEEVVRMIQPEALKKDEPLFWSPGIGRDVWELFCAADAGDLAALRRLLAKDPALVRSSYEGRTALAFAVRGNHLAAARLLLERGADPIHSGTPDTLSQMALDRGYEQMAALLEDRLTHSGQNPADGESLAEAIRARDLARVRRLLDAAPHHVHAIDARTNQPIHWAAMTRQLDVIDELADRGADMDAKRADGARPIQLANGDYHYRGWLKDFPTAPRQVIDHLRLRGATCDLCTACYIGDSERVRALLAEDPTVVNRPSEYVTYYACSGTPLRNAAAGGHIEIIQLLLANGADPNLPEEGIAPRGHALHTAVCNNRIDIVELLLQHGAHPNVEIESSADTLSAALARGNQAMVELLCSYGAARPVHLLAHANDLQTAAAVFAANPALADDPDALGSAVAHEGFVRLLLRYQPELPKRVSLAGRTREITEMLFAHGMDPNHANWPCITSLHRFAEAGDVENAALFIEHGAKLDVQDEEFCSTPLGYAAKYGRRRMVAFLLRRGADPHLPTDPPWATPLSWARRRGHEAIVQLLTRILADGTLPASSDRAGYERLASDLLAAYNDGDEDAAQRTASHFEIDPRTWNTGNTILQAVRRRVRERLGHRLDPSQGGEPLSIEAARLLTARWEGCANWDRLLDSAGAP
ncbi:MAG TPA: sigma-70 family RNA polymerase sigma factor [Limnochordia bacterium]|nr:sigma-70 family RNA polymerase sigma factor [Limnochordia bacterium]